MLKSELNSLTRNESANNTWSRWLPLVIVKDQKEPPKLVESLIMNCKSVSLMGLT